MNEKRKKRGGVKSWQWQREQRRMIYLHGQDFSLLFTPKKGSGRAMHGANNLRKEKEKEEKKRRGSSSHVESFKCTIEMVQSCTIRQDPLPFYEKKKHECSFGRRGMWKETSIARPEQSFF